MDYSAVPDVVASWNARFLLYLAFLLQPCGILLLCHLDDTYTKISRETPQLRTSKSQEKNSEVSSTWYFFLWSETSWNGLYEYWWPDGILTSEEGIQDSEWVGLGLGTWLWYRSWNLRQFLERELNQSSGFSGRRICSADPRLRNICGCA